MEVLHVIELSQWFEDTTVEEELVRSGTCVRNGPVVCYPEAGIPRIQRTIVRGAANVGFEAEGDSQVIDDWRGGN